MDHTEQLRTMVKLFAAQLRHAFPLVPGRDIKREVLKQLQRELPPHRGRPKASHLDKAEQLRAQGLSYGAICHKVNPRFALMTQSEQLYYRESIKRGLKARRSRTSSLGI